MLLVLRKVSSCLLTISTTSPLSYSVSLSRLNNMSSINNLTGRSSTSLRLAALAQQLRLYKPLPPPPDDLDDDETNSQLGFPESAIRNQPSERFKPKKAAVLICLFEGEVSLPGGKAEEDDVDDADTATREAKEEIGLDPSLVEVVTLLEPFLSKHLLQVIPVIGILSDKNAFNPIPNVAEVDEVFNAPLEMFLKDENRRSEEREWMGDRYLIHYFDYVTDGKEYLIWGLTAAILIRAASIVYKRPPAFLEQNPKFKLPGVVNKNTLMQ